MACQQLRVLLLEVVRLVGGMLLLLLQCAGLLARLLLLLLASMLLVGLLPRWPLGRLRRGAPLLPGGALVLLVLLHGWPGHGSRMEAHRHELACRQVLLHGCLRSGVSHERGSRRLARQLHP